MLLLLTMRRLACVLCGCALVACGDDTEQADAASQDADVDSATEEEHRDVYLPGTLDADDPLDFTPADTPDANPSYNPYPQPQDAAAPPDAEAPTGSCPGLSAGDSRAIDAELVASRTWRRIEPEGCPATRVTDREVAYAVHWVCAGDDAVMIDIAMLGADELGDDAVADPVLVVYSDTDALTTDPFGCLAVNDDGMFSAGIGNSARVEGLALGAGERVAIVATSYSRPDEHGVGAYRLELSAR